MHLIIYILKVLSDILYRLQDLTLFYLGCLVVDMIDYRSSPKNDRGVNSRIYLQPTSKSIWADVCRLQSQTGMPFDEDKALEIESELLVYLL
jgi:hypothetical protein